MGQQTKMLILAEPSLVVDELVFGAGDHAIDETIVIPLTNDAVPGKTRSFRVLLDGGAAIRVDILDDD